MAEGGGNWKKRCEEAAGKAKEDKEHDGWSTPKMTRVKVVEAREETGGGEGTDRGYVEGEPH